MEPNYSKLAEQYGSFLVAIAGVSITVLALVVATWRLQTKPDTDQQKNGETKSPTESKTSNNLPALVFSLIIATFCSFVGAQLMAETGALGNPGPTRFLLASVNIFNGVAVIIFAVMLVTTEYRTLNGLGIRRMSKVVYIAVLTCVFCWMIYSVVWRMPPPNWELSLFGPLGLVLPWFCLLGFLLHKKKGNLHEVLLPITFIVIIGFTVLSLLGFLCSLIPFQFSYELYLRLKIERHVQNATVWFFVLAVSSTCFGLLLSTLSLGRESEVCSLWPPLGWLHWTKNLASSLRSDAKTETVKKIDEPLVETTPPAGELKPPITEVTERMVRKSTNMSQRIPKILIISSDTGGGHRSAAAAIVAGVQKFFDGQSYAVRVVKAVEESHSITSKMVGIYNWVLRNKQHWMKYVYWAMNRFRPETREFFHRRCIGYVTELFERWCPHVVVSVHPLTQHIFGRVLKELKLADRIPLVSVVTDPYYGFWKGWACDDVTLYLVASDDARRQLIDYGIAPERIKISGMPVHPKFAYPGEQSAQAARRALGLDPEKFTVFVNAGWEGGGNIPQIFRELVRGELEVQAIFLAGRNEELRADAESLAKSASFPVKVIGYSDHVEQLMGAANVMISKLGGLTTFEAFACRLPIIADGITAPMPQEAGAASLIVKRGAGVLLQRATDIVPVIRRMVEDTAHYSAMRAATIGLAIPNATRHIVEEITALIPASTEGSEPVVLADAVSV